MVMIDRSNNVDKSFLQFTGGEDSPYLRKKAMSGPHLALLYAQHILKGRFPEGERALSQDAAIAVVYAKDILRGRFEAAESKIIADREGLEYGQMLKGINPQAYDEFREEHGQQVPGLR